MHKQRMWNIIFTMNVKDKNKKVVTETGVEPSMSRCVVSRLNQLDHRDNWAQGLPTLTIIRTLPFFSRERDRIPLPFRVPLVLSMFFWSLYLVCSAVRLSTRAFFRSLISCVRLANLRETKKASPYIKGNKLKRGREGKDSLTIIVHYCSS